MPRQVRPIPRASVVLPQDADRMMAQSRRLSDLTGIGALGLLTAGAIDSYQGSEQGLGEAALNVGAATLAPAVGMGAGYAIASRHSPDARIVGPAALAHLSGLKPSEREMADMIGGIKERYEDSIEATLLEARKRGVGPKIATEMKNDLQSKAVRSAFARGSRAVNAGMALGTLAAAIPTGIWMMADAMSEKG